MSERIAKSKIYDNVFTDLFSDPANQLKVYQSLHPEDRTATVADISDVTLQAVFLDQMYNDLGFTVGDRSIFLVEAQSSWSANIAIRCLMYLAQTYEQYLKKTRQNYYAERPVRLPKPEVFMLYTGDRHHDESFISLADTHWEGDRSVLDLKVKVLYEDNSNSILSQYVAFTRIYKKNRKTYGSSERAIMQTIDEMHWIRNPSGLLCKKTAGGDQYHVGVI